MVYKASWLVARGFCETGKNMETDVLTCAPETRTGGKIAGCKGGVTTGRWDRGSGVFKTPGINPYKEAMKI